MFRNSSSGVAVQSAQGRWRATSFPSRYPSCFERVDRIIWNRDSREPCVSVQSVSLNPTVDSAAVQLDRNGDRFGIDQTDSRSILFVTLGFEYEIISSNRQD